MRKIRILDVSNPSSFFIVMYSFSFIAILVMNFVTSNVFDFQLINFEMDRMLYAVLIIYLLTFIIFSYVVPPFVFNYRSSVYSYDRVLGCNISLAKISSLLLFSLFLIIHAYYFASIGFFPAFDANVGIVRVTAKSGYGGLILLANGACYAFALITASIFRSLSSVGKTVAILLCCIAAFVMALTGFRGPAAALFVLFFLTSYVNQPQYWLSRRIAYRVVMLATLFVIILASFDWIRHGRSASFEMFSQVFWTMSVNVFNLQNILSYFSSGDWYYGATFFNDLAVAIPGIESKFLGVELASRLGLSFEGEGLTVTAPGEGYVNFGLSGVIFHAAILGFLCEIIFRRLTRTNKSIDLMYLIFISFCFSKVPAAGVMPTLIFTFIPTAIFLIPVMRFIKTP